MIDIRDLCIGNWVYDGERTQFPMYVQTIGEDYVYLDFEGNEADPWESEPKDLFGIPLTEELLEKMGFSFFGYGLWGKDQQDRHISINISREFVAIESYKDRLCDSRCTCHGVRFVHELQNLFWNITKQQLKVNL